MSKVYSTAAGSRSLLATLALSLAIISLTCIFAPQPARAAGTTRNVSDYKSLQGAIDAAQTGDTVFIPAGTWAGATISGKSGITLVGDGAASVVSSSGQDVIRIQSSSNITLSSFAIRGDYSVTTQRGVGIFGLTTGQIINLDIANVGFSGIYSNGTATNVTVSGSKIVNCGDFGIQFKAGASQISITGNSLSGFASRLYPGHGIYLEGVSNANISQNIVSDVPQGPGGYEISGIKVTEGGNVTVTNNVVSNAVAGISLPYAWDTIVSGNTLSNIAQRGVYILCGSYDNVIQNNVIENSPVGFMFAPYDSWPTRITITGNVLVNTPIPVSAGSATDLVIENNSWQGSTTATVASTTTTIPVDTAAATTTSTTAIATTTNPTSTWWTRWSTITTQPTTTSTTATVAAAPAPTTTVAAALPTTTTPTTVNTSRGTDLATLAITSPADNAIVEGRVSVRMVATSTNPISEVQLYIDGSQVARDYNAPYSFNWNTRSLAPGSPHTLTGVAVDRFGNQLARASARVTVAGQAAVVAEETHTSTVAGITFPDVSPTSPYSEAITTLAETGVVTGFLDGQFGIDLTATRAQFAKMTVNALGLAVDESTTSPFTDLDATSVDTYPQKYIAALYSAGAVTGVTSTEFSPWSPITRAQMVTTLVRAIEALDPGTLTTPPAGTLSVLGDISIDHTQTMAVAEANGLLAGIYGYGPSWNPWDPATRGEVAQVLSNVTKLN